MSPVSRRSEVLQIRLEPDLFEGIERLARERETNLSAEARRAIKILVQNTNGPPRPGEPLVNDQPKSAASRVKT